jgi:hypothetical protein
LFIVSVKVKRLRDIPVMCARDLMVVVAQAEKLAHKPREQISQQLGGTRVPEG